MSESYDLVGDFERNVLAKLPAAGIEIAKTAAPELADLARESWDAGETPYGATFVGKNGPVTLKKSGAMEASESFIPIGNKILVRVTAPYAKYHLKQGFMPTGGIPQSWDAAIARESEQALDKVGR